MPESGDQPSPPLPPPQAPLPVPPPTVPTSNCTSLYVGDLHPDVTDGELKEAFQKKGFVANVRICRDCRDAETSKSLGYAYANFVSHSEAARALECMNHTTLKGKPVRMMWSSRDPLPRKAGVANLFVKNLDPSVTGGQLQGIFCKYGNILSCKVAEENGKSKGFGFVQFDSDESAMAALNALHDTMVEGKKIYVAKFVRKNERNAANGDQNFTNLYVKNLCDDLTEDDLREKFSQFGIVSSSVIMKDVAGKSKGFGFVNFESPKDARQAVQALNGAAFGSKNLFVGRAQKKAEREQLLKRERQPELSPTANESMASNLYVKNLDSSINDQMLRECFSAYGRVTSVKVMRDDKGVSRGFGFVSFSTAEESKKALAILNGSYFEGRYIYVAMAQRKEDREKLLQSSYYDSPPAPSLCGSSWYPLQTSNALPSYDPQLISSHVFAPNVFQYSGKNIGGPYPVTTPAYQEYYPYISASEVQGGPNDPFSYLQAFSSYQTDSSHIHFGANRNELAGTPLKGSATAKKMLAKTFGGGNNQQFGDRLQPPVENQSWR